MAIYAKPHIMDNGTIAVIMADGLTHQNLQSMTTRPIFLWKKVRIIKINVFFWRSCEKKRTANYSILCGEKNTPLKKKWGKPFFGLFQSRGGLTPERGRSRELDNQRLNWQRGLATPKDIEKVAAPRSVLNAFAHLLSRIGLQCERDHNQE